MKRFLIYLTAVMLLAACNSESKIAGRAQELCRHIPVPEQLEQSRNFLTEDFYAVLDTMFNLPDTSEVLHEWEFWFCAADGSSVAIRPSGTEPKVKLYIMAYADDAAEADRRLSLLSEGAVGLLK